MGRRRRERRRLSLNHSRAVRINRTHALTTYTVAIVRKNAPSAARTWSSDHRVRSAATGATRSAIAARHVDRPAWPSSVVLVMDKGYPLETNRIFGSPPTRPLPPIVHVPPRGAPPLNACRRQLRNASWPQ